MQSRGADASRRFSGTVCEFSSHAVSTPFAQKCRAKQGTHTSKIKGLYIPFGQVLHSVEPRTATCLFVHSVHVETEVASNLVENVFTGHLSQSEFPFTSPAYVPGIHGKHCV